MAVLPQHVRCPACGNPMLSMQTRADSMEGCPHCSFSAPRSQFQPLGGRGANPLPMQRRVIHRHDAPPPAAQPPIAQPPVPAQPYAPAAAHSGHQRFGPTAAHYPAQQPQPAAVAPVPLAVPAEPAPPMSKPPAAALTPWDPYAAPVMQPLPAIHEEEEEARPAPQVAAATWPGHGLESAATAQDTFESISRPPQRSAPAILPVFVPQETTAAPVTPGQGMSWLNTIAVWLFSLVILAGGGYLVWDWWKTQQDNLAAQTAENAKNPPKQRATPEGAALPAADAVATEVLGQTPVINTQQIDLVVAATEAQSVLEGLYKAKTLEERLSFIDDGETHRAAVEKFFADKDATSLLALKRFPIAPLWIPGKEPFPLFQIITKENRAGAMARLNKGGDEKYRLNWPMFEESHGNRVHEFIDNPPTEAKWFYAGLRRSHGLELSETLRENFHAFDFQGSPNDSARVYAYAAKNSPVGRFLAKQMAWGGVYMAHILVRWSDLAPQRQGIQILACEGDEGEDKGASKTDVVTPAPDAPEPAIDIRKAE